MKKCDCRLVHVGNPRINLRSLSHIFSGKENQETRKPLYLMVETVVYSRFPLQPIQ